MSRRQWNRWIVDLMWGPPSRRSHRGWHSARQARRRLCRGIQPLENRAVLSTASVVTTGQAELISTTGATVTGSVNPEGSTAKVVFQYSSVASFTPTIATTIGSGVISPSAVAADAAGDVYVLTGTGSASGSTVTEFLASGGTIVIGTTSLFGSGITVDEAGDVFVSLSDDIEEILPGGATETIGSGFNSPEGLAVDAAGDVFVADTDNNAVKEVLPNHTIRTIGTGFNNPSGVAVDKSGDVYVADQGDNAVKQVLPGGTIKTIGSGFNDPIDVAVDAVGDVFVADYFNNAVKEILPGNRATRTFASGFVFLRTITSDAAGDVFVIDAAGLSEVLPDGGTKTIGLGVSSPLGVGIDAAGDVFASDYSNGVLEVLPSGTTVAVGTWSMTPQAIAVDAAGDVFASFPLNGDIEERLATGTTRTLSSTFLDPSALAVDASGDVFVADTGNNTVSEILPNGSIKTVASGFNLPDGVAVDAVGDVFVADSGGGTVDEVLPDHSIKTIASGLSGPDGLAVDAAGDVFVAEPSSGAIEEVLPGGSIASVGSGFLSPTGVAVDALGDLFVADSQETGVTVLSPTSASADPSPVSGSTATQVAATLTGLTQGTKYYFRAVASSAGSTVIGQTASFTTAGSGNGGAAPALGVANSAVTYALGSPPEAIVPSATLSSGDGAFANALLSVVDADSATHPSDRLSIASSSNLVVNGASLAYGGESIGTFAGGTDGVLSISFNASATKAAIVTVVENVSFSTSAAGTRSIGFQLTDGSGNLGAVVTQTIECPLPASAVVTGPANSVSQTAATLTGVVNPEGAAAEVAFQYSTSSSLIPTVGKLIGTGFSGPFGVAVDGAGDPFVVDDSNHVTEILANGTIGTFSLAPYGMTVDGAGDVYVSFFSGPVQELLTGGGTRTLGSGFDEVQGLAVDAAGDVFFASSDPTLKDEVGEILPSGETKPIGSGFNDPSSVAVDAAGDVFVADTLNNAIKEVLPDGSTKTIGSGFVQPRGVAVDTLGDVVVADTGNGDVKEILPDGSIQVIGSGFGAPQSVAVDAAGNVFVADADKTQIVELSPPTIAATPSPLTGSAATPVSGAATGLVRGTNYYFRVVASVPGDMVAGNVVSFTTAQGAPELSIGGPSATYSLGAAPIAVAPAATLSTGDAAFANASLSIVDTSFSSYPSDRLSIASSDSLAIAGASLVYRGTTIGSFTGGDKGTLAISFDASATQAAVLEVARDIAFTTAAFGSRSLRFQLTDGLGNVDDPVTQTILTALPPSAVVTGPATNVSATSASLTGTVNAEGTSVSASFQYSTDSNFVPSVQRSILGYAGFSGPSGIAVDAAGDIFVADTGNNAVEEILPDRSARIVATGLSSPRSLAVDKSDDVFVVDSSGVWEILADGDIRTIGSGFFDPQSVAVDMSGDVFVTNDYTVDEVLPDGHVKIIGSGFIDAEGVAVDNAGDVFVADAYFPESIKEVLPDGTIKTISTSIVPSLSLAVDGAGDLFVAGLSSFESGIPGPAVEEILPNGMIESIGAGFNNPGGVAVDAKGDVFIADTGNNLVKEILPDGTIKTIGSPFSNPAAVALDSLGDVFLAEQADGDVKELLAGGGEKVIGSGLVNLGGVAVDATGDVFVTERPTSYAGVVAEIRSDGTVETIGSGFRDPTRIAVDGAGDLFVSDVGDNTVKEVLPNGSVQIVVSGLRNPNGLAVDAAGNIYVADTGNKAVKKISPASPGEYTIETIGYGFGAPSGVAVDPFGDVFIADTEYNDVKEVFPDGSITTIGSTFNQPTGVAVDAAGDVFVLETSVVELSPPTVPAKPSPVTGSTPTAVTAALTGLTPDTSYYFRLVAFGGSGPVVGETALGETLAEFITPPDLADVSAQTQYYIGGAAVAIAPNATSSQGDAGFDKTSLVISDTNGGATDQLSIAPGTGLSLGTAAASQDALIGQPARTAGLAAAGSTIGYFGTVIGSFTGGSGTTPLVVTFNGLATPDAVLEIVRGITFGITTILPSNVDARQLTLQFVNGSGSSTVSETITLPNVQSQAVQFTGTITLIGTYLYDNTVTITGGASSPVQISDPDGTLIFASTIDSPDGSQLTINAASVQFYGDVGSKDQPLQDLTVETGGQFAIANGITTSGSTTITVQPIAPSDEVDLDLRSGANIEAGAGIKLLSYNGVTIEPGSTVSAATSLTIYSDYIGGSAFNNSGAAINLGGDIHAPAIAVQGGNNDLLNIEDVTEAPGKLNGNNTISGFGIDGTLSFVGIQPAVMPYEKYVEQVFLDVLQRAADASGLQYWTQQIAVGLPISNVAEEIGHSPEYYRNFVVAPAFVELLGRPADPAGLSYWGDQLENGLTDQQLQAGFVSTDEFYNKAGGTDVKWIDDIFQVLLGRPADASGEIFWTGELAQGMSRLEVAAAIADGTENNTAIINADYLHYLGRPADANGLTFWLNAFSAGATNEDVIAAFTGSAEYYKKATGVEPS